MNSPFKVSRLTLNTSLAKYNLRNSIGTITLAFLYSSVMILMKAPHTKLGAHMPSKKSHYQYLNQCTELAQQAIKNGDHPFGAVLVLNDQVVCYAKNEVNTNRDITAHAELMLLRKAQKTLTLAQIQKCILYTSTEPCAMCAGAIYWIGIKEIIYGCSTETLFSIVKDGLFISSKDIFDKGTRKIKVINLSNEVFSQIHRSFWKKIINKEMM